MENWRLDIFPELDSTQDMHAVLKAALKPFALFGFKECGWRALIPQHARQGYAMLHTAEDSVLFVKNTREHYDEASVLRTARIQKPPFPSGERQRSVVIKSTFGMKKILRMRALRRMGTVLAV